MLYRTYLSHHSAVDHSSAVILSTDVALRWSVISSVRGVVISSIVVVEMHGNASNFLAPGVFSNLTVLNGTFRRNLSKNGSTCSALQKSVTQLNPAIKEGDRES